MNITNNVSITIPLISNNYCFMRDSSILDKVIGQKEVLRKLKFFVNSHSPVSPVPSMLFSGSQGLGKSFMAKKMAESLGRELIEVNCGNILTVKDFVKGVLIDKVLGNKPVTLFLDEAHQLNSEITTILLSLLNPNEQNKTTISYENTYIEYDFANINTIFATTDAHKMFKPLLNRCVEVYFSLYTNDDLFDILCGYLKGIKVTCNKKDIAYACRGRARDAFVISQHINRYCIMNKINYFDAKGFSDIKEIFGIHHLGLNSQEINMLRIIRDNGYISSNNIAIKMGVNVQNIESEIEIRSKELGFIEMGSRGRCLTKEGLDYLKAIE